VKFSLGRSSAQDAMDMGMVNAVIPHAELEDTAYEWAQEIRESPGYQNAKFAMNLTDDGMVGQQVLQVKPRFYMTEEATEGRNAFLKNVSQTFEKNGCHNSV
jgi:naphthoate synthase